jgi:hypothetical protein
MEGGSGVKPALQIQAELGEFTYVEYTHTFNTPTTERNILHIKFDLDGLLASLTMIGIKLCHVCKTFCAIQPTKYATSFCNIY